MENINYNPIDPLSSQYFLTIMDWEVLRKWEEEDKEYYKKRLIEERIKTISIIRQIIIKNIMNYNKIILAGRIATDLTLKMTPSSIAVLKFNIAVNEYFKDKAGNKQEKVSFIPCIAWKSTAERISQFCKKGDLLMLDGKLTINEYEKKDGSKSKSVEVMVENPQFAPKQKVEAKEEPVDELPIIDNADEIDINDIPF